MCRNLEAGLAIIVPLSIFLRLTLDASIMMLVDMEKLSTFDILRLREATLGLIDVALAVVSTRGRCEKEE